MGVQGLWDLLSPVGRRVSIETLAGKKLAIDASIWMIQFMKAMRDEKGEMVRNAHILGFFRRICKLLFLRIKPVFVFDGGTPALKRRTVIARRRQRENAQAKIRKTAEKLLLNHLKEMRLKELADKYENERPKNVSKGKGVVLENTDAMQVENQVQKSDPKGKSVVLESDGAKEVENLKLKNDLKGKSIVSENDDAEDSSLKENDKFMATLDQESLDEMLAASLAAEEDGTLVRNASASVGGDITLEEDDEDGDDEMILPVMDGNVDPSILAALPPSMQLDLLVQMRERLMAENRQKYQKVKKAPAKFSELQIQSYLKTVAFRREIDQVQKSAAGKGVGGVQTSRIASEASREYIFSSSFTGDKKLLMSDGSEKNGDTLVRTTKKAPILSDYVDQTSSIAQSSSATGPGVNDGTTGLDDDVGTYLDERGRIRLSRVRAMGFRMTRDLQRNLDMMKEIEQEKRKESNVIDIDAILNKVVGSTSEASLVNNQMEASHEGIDNISCLDERINISTEGRTLPVPEKIRGLEISFIEDDKGNKIFDDDDDDDLFANLVAGSSVTLSPAKTVPFGNNSPGSGSDCSWEEGSIEEKAGTYTNDLDETNRLFVAKGNFNCENEVEREQGVPDIIGSCSAYSTVTNEPVSKGSLEEEADIQEAIRRSLVNFTHERPITPSEKEKHETLIEMGNRLPEVHVSSIGEKDLLQNSTSREAVAGLHKLDYVGETDVIQINNSPGKSALETENGAKASLETENGAKASLVQKPCERNRDLTVGNSINATSEFSSSHMEKPSTYPGSPMELKDVMVTDQGYITEGDKSINLPGAHSKDGSHISATVMGEINQENLVDSHQNYFETPATRQSNEMAEIANYLNESSTKETGTSVGIKQDLVAEEILGAHIQETRHIIQNSATESNSEVQVEFSGASLDEEMLHLRQERIELGDEQRKLERNAEAVSSEMFAECQELLQMFGLPYIIAPMEAEAQCAYMELANLVDGVVTDDSDVFLFGARSVYKNIFDDRKYVETYFMKDIETELGLSRQQLIRMALLLGSDYTEGISGIGIVNAIEVVNAFPEEDGLQKFREWLESPDPSILGTFGAQTGKFSRKRGSKVTNSDTISSKGNVVEESTFSGKVSHGRDDEQSPDAIQHIKQIFMEKHRNVSKNWHIPTTFPSEAIISAYVSPQVDTSTDPFSWGKPDLFVLRKLCLEKFGWSDQKADELLVPVLKEYNKRETQLRLEAFYTFNEKFAKFRSKRIKKAVKGITGKRSSELIDDNSQETSKAKIGRKVSSSGPEGNEENPNLEKNNTAGIQCDITKLSTPTKTRRKKVDGVPEPSYVGISEEHRQNTKNGSRANVRGRGRGRGRVRGRVRAVGRGKQKEVLVSESTETSSDHTDNYSDEPELQVKSTEKLYQTRRSTRSRKNVRYMEDDLEADELRESSKQSEQTCMDKAGEQEPLHDEGIIGHAAAAASVSINDSGSPLKDGCYEDYLEMGGGFCLEKEDDNPDQLVSRSVRAYNHDNRDEPIDNGCSVDYLTVGGGFCMDEVDKDTEPVQLSCSPAGKLDEPLTREETHTTAPTKNLDSPSKEGNSDSITVSVSPAANDFQKADSVRASATTGLSAMPSLKRRRKT